MSTSFQTLRQVLDALGVPNHDIEKAEADGTLGLLVVERMILADQDPKYNQAEVAALSDLGDEAAASGAHWGSPIRGPTIGSSATSTSRCSNSSISSSGSVSSTTTRRCR